MTSLSHPRTARPMVSDQALASYRDKGWAIVEGVFAAEEIDRVVAVAMQVSRAELLARPDDASTVDAGEDGHLGPRKVDYPFLKHAEFRRFALDPRFSGLASAFLGRPGYLIRDSLFMKPPRFGTAKPYHQENATLLIDPPDDVVVAWVALDNVTASNGALRFIDGSHRTPLPHAPLPDATYHQVPVPGSVDLARESVAPVGKGGVVVFHSQTLHSSQVNRSGSWRRAHSSHWVTDRATCGSDALRHGYSRTVGQGRYPHRSP